MSYNGWDSEKERTVEMDASLPSDGLTTSKSSAELMEEIAKFEVQIVHLERHLLSLYQTLEKSVEQMNGRSRETELGMSNRLDQSSQSSRISSFRGPSSLESILSSSFRKEKQSSHSRSRSLADHLGSSYIDNSLIPDRLSEDMIRCMLSIYCNLSSDNATNKGPAAATTAAASRASSFRSTSAFSPKNLSGSWSPQYNEIFGLENLIKREDEHHRPVVVEILKISFDNERYSHVTAKLEKFRSLVKSLENVDPTKMRREEKLAFWINIHNALLMHAYLAYGTQNHINTTGFMKAAYFVGGHDVNAYDIESSILGISPHYSESWFQTLISPGRKSKTGSNRHPYAIEYPEPLVHFAICSGSHSDPMVRVYKAKSVFQDLEVAKEEFIQATVYVQKRKKIYLPRVLNYYAKDMALETEALLKVVTDCLPPIQRKAIMCIGIARLAKHLRWMDENSSFRYLILM